MSSLKDKVIIITGAVGNLGHAVAERVQSEGGRMVLVDRSSDRLQKTWSGLKDPARHWLAGNVDMT
ncbi:MAG TPA: SDR family NAD(P)-dependent oxidoreductase, partial [Sulfuricaulis sp.]|nr:SDR family NAD(P)-dependent oxidoreductase [Sulfuricaulis sp.]